MEQRLENSTLIALRELRSYEKERQLAERRKQEEEARQARERKERERQVEEAAREQVLEKQLRTDLQHAEEEIHLLKQEADLRLREANHALQALQALASVPQASDSPVKAPSLRRGTWLAASGCTALLASALVLVIGLRRDPSTPVQDTRQTMSCPGSSTSAQLPSSAAAETTATVLERLGGKRQAAEHLLRYLDLESDNTPTPWLQEAQKRLQALTSAGV